MKKITKNILVTGLLAAIAGGSCFAETTLVIRTPIVEIKHSLDNEDLEVCVNASHHHTHYHGVECKNNRKHEVASKSSKVAVKKPAPRRPEPKNHPPKYEPHRPEPPKREVPNKNNGKVPVNPRHEGPRR